MSQATSSSGSNTETVISPLTNYILRNFFDHKSLVTSEPHLNGNLSEGTNVDASFQQGDHVQIEMTDLNVVPSDSSSYGIEELMREVNEEENEFHVLPRENGAGELHASIGIADDTSWVKLSRQATTLLGYTKRIPLWRQRKGNKPETHRGDTRQDKANWLMQRAASIKDKGIPTWKGKEKVTDLQASRKTSPTKEKTQTTFTEALIKKIYGSPSQENHSPIDIFNPNAVQEAITRKINHPSPYLFLGSQISIYKVHKKFRKINEDAYTPHIISIGPFHHGQENFPAMEKHKLRYVNAFLARTGKTIRQCTDVIWSIEDKARKCYSELISLKKNDFVELMIIDGLFIIELFLKTAGEVNIEDDPTFTNIWTNTSLTRDLVLMENQLPMCVLDELFNLQPTWTKNDAETKRGDETKKGKEAIRSTSFPMLALRFYDTLMPREKLDENLCSQYCQGSKHLLDLLGKSFHPTLPKQSDGSNTNTWKLVPCVTDLKRAGVKFKKGPSSGSFLDIQFRDGVLEIPHTAIQHNTETLLRNLIASEQSCNGQDTYMTSYAYFMDSLINTPEDVRLLRLHGIITSHLGDDKAVSTLFNKLCDEVSLVKFYYADLSDQINKYCEGRCHVWRATLSRDYFYNPCAVLSFVAAFFLLVLTLASTLFAVLSFVVHKS